MKRSKRRCHHMTNIPTIVAAMLAAGLALSCGTKTKKRTAPAPASASGKALGRDSARNERAGVGRGASRTGPSGKDITQTSGPPETSQSNDTAVPRSAQARSTTPVPIETHKPRQRLSPAQAASYLARLRNGQNQVQGKVRAYRIDRGLRNVQNRRDFSRELSRRQKRLLASQGFVAVPSTKFSQLYEIYEANDYARPHRYPSFITTDTMLHAYHLLFDAALAEVETHGLTAAITRMSRSMMHWSQANAAKVRHPLVRRALMKNAAFFAVAVHLLTGNSPRVAMSPVVQREVAKIMAHSTTEVSALLGTKVDFTMFIPRGHYTKSTRLKRYFRAMMWYGLASMPLSIDDKSARLATIQALLMTRGLERAKHGNAKAIDLWSSVYDITKTFVGPADDLTPLDYRRVMAKVWAPTEPLDHFADPAKLAAFAKQASSLPLPKIRQFFRDRPKSEQGRKFRLMGQRFIYDSRIMQQLVLPRVPGRKFPSALDVPAAFGFDRAKARAVAGMSNRIKPSYLKALAEIRAETASLGQEQWHSNLSFEVLHTLAATLMDVPSGYPSFMRHPNWQDRMLLAFLGPWTELRHDTILYAKPAGLECGGDEEELAMPKGYIEPNIELWTRLAALARNTGKALWPYRIRGKVGEIRRGFKSLAKWADFAAKISRKELTGGTITRQEYEKMTVFGGYMEDLHATSVTKGDFKLLTQKQHHMALVADVHSSGSMVLEEAVGAPAIIYVVVPLGRSLQIARGAIFTHYQFTRPASKRMTDDAWKSVVIGGKTPPTWPWLKSLMTEPPRRVKVVSRLPEC